MPESFASTKPLRRVEDQHAGAGAVEEIGPAVAVDVADGQRVALDGRPPMPSVPRPTLSETSSKAQVTTGAGLRLGERSRRPSRRSPWQTFISSWFLPGFELQGELVLIGLAGRGGRSAPGAACR